MNRLFLKDIRIIAVSIFSLLMITSCKKNDSSVAKESDTFLHTYNSEKDENCYFIHPASDNGYLIVSGTDHNTIQDQWAVNIKKVDALGRLEWTNTFEDSIYDPQITDLNDCSVLINSVKTVILPICWTNCLAS